MTGCVGSWVAGWLLWARLMSCFFGLTWQHTFTESLSDDDDVVKLEKVRAERGKWAKQILQRKKEIFGQTPEVSWCTMCSVAQSKTQSGFYV